MAKQEVCVRSALHRGDYRKLTYWNMFGKDRRVGALFGAMLLVGAALLGCFFDNLSCRILGIVFCACPVLAIPDHGVPDPARAAPGGTSRRAPKRNTAWGRGASRPTPLRSPTGFAVPGKKSAAYTKRGCSISSSSTGCRCSQSARPTSPRRNGRALLSLVHTHVPKAAMHLREVEAPRD